MIAFIDKCLPKILILLNHLYPWRLEINSSRWNSYQTKINVDPRDLILDYQAWLIFIYSRRTPTFYLLYVLVLLHRVLQMLKKIQIIIRRIRHRVPRPRTNCCYNNSNYICNGSWKWNKGLVLSVYLFFFFFCKQVSTGCKKSRMS